MDTQKKIILLGKDGTLITPKSGGTFVQQPWDQEPLPGVKEAIAHYHCQGWKMAIISNQEALTMGLKSLETVIAEMRFSLELFPEIEEAYFCPDFGGMNCYRVSSSELTRYHPKSDVVWELSLRGQFRKPNPGMAKLAAHLHAANEVWLISADSKDKEAASNAGIDFMPADIWRTRFLPGIYGSF